MNTKYGKGTKSAPAPTVESPQAGEDFDLRDAALLPEDFEDRLLKREPANKEQKANPESTMPAADDSRKE